MAKYHQGKFRCKNPQRYIGDVNNIHYRSGLELKFMYYLDTSPNVISWASEEVKVPYYSPVHKYIKNYYPDFIVKTKTDTTMIEIKPESQSKPPVRGKKRDKAYLRECLTYSINEAKWKSAAAWCREHKMKFRLMTERDLNGR